MKTIKYLLIIVICMFLQGFLFGQEVDEKRFIKKFGLPEDAYNIKLSGDSIPIQWNIPSEVPGLVGVVIAGKPPEKFRAPIAYPTDGSVILNNVPAFNWSFGCSATAAAMLAGYYDNMGLPNMYNGPTNNGVMPMDNSYWGTVIINGELRHQCPISATRNGVDGRTTRGHVDDYWVSYLSTLPDPYITGGWSQHTYGECTGDFMKTNQSAKDNVDASTKFWYWSDGTPYSGNENDNDGGYGLKLFIQSRGYSISSHFNQYILEAGYSNGFTFNQYKTEIDAGRPVLIHVTGHTMLGIGYNTSGNTVYLHDTWDYSMHEMIWGQSYSGMQHDAVTVIRIQEALPYNIVLSQPNTIGTFTASNQITMNPGFTTGTSNFVAQIYVPNKSGLIKIFSEGKMVKEILIETEFSGIYPDLWDGTNASGEKMPAGKYHYTITKEGAEIENGVVLVE